MLAIIVIVAALVITVLISGIIYVVSEDESQMNLARTEKEEEEMAKFLMAYGAEGKDVAEMQKLLQAAGSTIKVNGKYTIGMLTAVKTFQKKHGLEVTGKIDTKTANKLKTYAKPAKPARKAAVKKAAK